MIRNFFKWVFKDELLKLETQIRLTKDATINYESMEKRIKNILGNFDVSIDVHQYSPSWAVFSIQGEKSDYIKFIELGKRDIIEIKNFIRKYERDTHIKVDASPIATPFLIIDRKK